MSLPTEEIFELTGRMYEAIDIEHSIESGQFQTLDDVLLAVKARSGFIQKKLESSGVEFARSISMDEFKGRF